MQDFHKLAVFQKAHQLTLAVYETTRRFPKDELYGLTNQSRRAAASIPANIAEGCGRSGNNDFARFLQIAIGSASELEYHFLLARDLGFVTSDRHDRLTTDLREVKRMLTSLIQKVRSAGPRTPTTNNQQPTTNNQQPTTDN